MGSTKRISQPKLKKILEQHKLWLESDGEKGERADLQGAYLRHADLRGAYLRGAYLWGADLRHADLRHADLLDANLRSADLQGAYLRHADLRGAYLWRADLQDAELDINIRDCWSFGGAKFTHDALPWLILHPKWSEWKDSVQIEEV